MQRIARLIRCEFGGHGFLGPFLNIEWSPSLTVRNHAKANPMGPNAVMMKPVNSSPSSQVLEIFERNGLTKPWGLSGAGVRLGSGWVRMSNHAACSIELLQHHYPDMDEKTRVRANASMLRLSELWNV